MTTLPPPAFDSIAVWLQSLNEMAWTVMGDAMLILLAGFIVLFMMLAIMKGIGAVLRR